jgi:hypothetical protein
MVGDEESGGLPEGARVGFAARDEEGKMVEELSHPRVMLFGDQDAAAPPGRHFL